MNKFQNRMIQFMYGRRGFDVFSRDLSFLALALILLDIVVPGSVLNTLGLIVLLYAYYRAFSRNLTKRQAECDWYMTFIRNKITRRANRDYKNYRYFKCPECKQVLRAPKGRGTIRVTCSRCQHKFEKKV